jgi:hypothetical protein
MRAKLAAGDRRRGPLGRPAILLPPKNPPKFAFLRFQRRTRYHRGKPAQKAVEAPLWPDTVGDVWS